MIEFDGLDGFDVDPKLEGSEGVKITLPGTPYWFQCLRAGGGNRKFARILSEKAAPYQALLSKGDQESDDIWERLQMEAFAEAIVIGWNATAKGEPVPLTAENVLALFKGYPEAFRYLRAQADSVERFRRRAVEDAAKN